MQFKRPPHLPFPIDAVEQLEANALVLRIQPDEGISLRFGAKAPDADARAPDRQHGLPVRLVVPRRGARGVRDADPRRDPRRRHALHARRTASSARGSSSIRCSSSGGRGSPQVYDSGSWGPDLVRRAPGPRRAPVAAAVSAERRDRPTSRPSRRCCAPRAAATERAASGRSRSTWSCTPRTRSGSSRRIERPRARRPLASAARDRGDAGRRRAARRRWRARAGSGASDRQVCSERVLVDGERRGRSRAP